MKPTQELIDNILRGRYKRREGNRRQLCPSDLVGMSKAQIAYELGLSDAGAKVIHAVMELAEQAYSAAPKRVAIKIPEDVQEHFGHLGTGEIEKFWCIPLDARSCLIGEPILISTGDVDGTDAGPRAFFRNALRVGAVSAIAIHNHPTGDPSPSPADKEVTERLIGAGRQVDVWLMDHVILAPGSAAYSIRREEPQLWTSC